MSAVHPIEVLEKRLRAICWNGMSPSFRTLPFT
jgi:hypothetical protein